MLTKYERELTEYWKNWKPGMPPFGKKPEDYDEGKKKVKNTKKSKREKPTSREIMEEIQFELGIKNYIYFIFIFKNLGTMFNSGRLYL